MPSHSLRRDDAEGRGQSDDHVRLTTLYRLEPEWTAGGQLESLSSYFVRLSAAHCVSPRTLLKHVVVPSAKSFSGALLPGFNAGFGAPVNGLGPYAATFARTLNTLTGRDDLQQLTLRPLDSLLTFNGPGLIGSRRRWCPYCLYEAASSAQPIVSPLSWHLALYNVCPGHQLPLASACQNCLREQPIIPPISTYALCAYCEHPLYQKGRANEGKDVPTADLERARVHVSILDGLLEWATAGRRTNLRAHFCKAISALADKFGDGSAATFFRRVGLPAMIGKRWLAHQEKPSLPQFIRVCEALDAKPSELLGESQKELTARVQAQLSRGEPVALVESIVVRKVSNRFTDEDRRKIAEKLKAKLAKPTTYEVIDLARELGMTKFALRYWFPTEYRAVSVAASKQRAKALAAKERAIRKEIKATCRLLNAHGVYPSKHRVKNALKRTGQISRWNQRLEQYLKEAQAAPNLVQNGGEKGPDKNVLSTHPESRRLRQSRS